MSLSLILFFSSCLLAYGFQLPSSFLGLWSGAVSTSVFGPFDGPSYVFSISQAPNGDYLLENNINYDEFAYMGYQRFYVEGTGATEGNLWYCGNLSHFANTEEITGDERLNGFKLHESSDDSVTFCLDSDSERVMQNGMNPFMVGCQHCDCANWTIFYSKENDMLSSQLSMSGSPGHTHSKHVWVTMERTGPAPVITDEDVGGHGDDFSCDFGDGGRDGEPVDRDDSTSIPSGHNIVMKDALAGGVGCPHMQARQSLDKASLSDTGAPLRQSSKRASSTISTTESRDFCYVINDYTDTRLAWTLDEKNQLLHVTISAIPVGDNVNNSYVSIGFRPMSRASGPDLTVLGTGRHMNFGMEGADIVVGSVSGGVRSLYAELYTGPPVPDSSLQITDAKVEVVDSRVVLTFTRPLVGGYLFENYGYDASIVSPAADIIWAVGVDSKTKVDGVSDENTSGCEYHNNNRGMRFVDWQRPFIAMWDAWKC